MGSASAPNPSLKPNVRPPTQHRARHGERPNSRRFVSAPAERYLDGHGPVRLMIKHLLQISCD
jgi:hypothetical protein